MKSSVPFYFFLVLLGVVPESTLRTPSVVDPPPTISSDEKHDLSNPLQDVSPEPELRSAGDEEQEGRELPRATVRSASSPGIDPVLQSSANSSAQFSPGLSFDGVDHVGWAVGDPNLAVGATQVVQWVNTRFAVYDKQTGAIEYGPANGNTLWSGFGGPCANNNNGDPIVQYDKAAGRWVMLQHATPTGGPYLMCLAVSTASDATGSFRRYAFSLSNSFSDYPKLGVWSDGYYISFEQLIGGTLITSVCALDRIAMLKGASATAVCFRVNSKYVHLLPSDIDGLIAPPAGSPAYFMNFGTDSLNIWQFHVDFVSPSNSTWTGPTNIPVAAFTQSCGGGICVPQSGTTNKLDSVADRLMYRLAYRHFSDGHESLVAAHTVGAPAGIRWYEIRSPGTPIVYQRGTYSPNSNYRWMPSVAMDRAGNMAVGYSLSSSAIHPSIAYTGRLSTATLGTMQAETILLTGGGSELTGNSKWDDYTALSVDPQDDCTFWYTNQYYKANSMSNWSTRIASFKFSTCTP